MYQGLFPYHLVLHIFNSFTFILSPYYYYINDHNIKQWIYSLYLLKRSTVKKHDNYLYLDIS